MALRIILFLFSFIALAFCDSRLDNPQIPIVGAKHPPKRVAIIGAGAAGSSSAYHLAQYAREASIPISITVYERSDYIGGRSTTVPVYDDHTLGLDVELGASIFVEVNRILFDAVKEFNLSVESFSSSRRGDAGESEDVDAGDEPKLLGIWNGESFVFTQTVGDVSWWRDLLSKAKLFWRYGMAPLKTVRLMQNITGRFFDMYDEPLFPWKNGLSDVVEASGLLGATALTGSQFLNFHGIGELFSQEIIQASTRVNYAQNLGLIHGLETMVCMATDGAMSVKGGNYQIFSNMLETSRATVRLSTDVTSIHKHADTSYVISSTASTTPTSITNETFDAIILAAPYHQADIRFSSSHASGELPAKDSIPSNIPYVNLHVTLFASPFLLSPSAFNLDPSSKTPDVILSTLKPSEQARLGETMNGTNVGSAGFYSISILRTVKNPATKPRRQEYVYKIFSPEKISDEFLWYILYVNSESSSFGDENSKEESADQDAEATKLRSSESAKEESTQTIPPAAFTFQQASSNLYRRVYDLANPILNHIPDLLNYAPYVTQPLRNTKQPSQHRNTATDSQKHPPKTTGTHPDASITWIKRHTWNSYPYLPPRVTFDAHKLDGDNGGLWYTSGIESFISTMETSALMGKNVARLMVDEWSIAASGSSGGGEDC